MTEQQWLSCIDVGPMLELVITKASNRLRRLFGVGKPKSFQGESDLTTLVQLIIENFLLAVGTILGWCHPKALCRAATRG